MEDRTDCFGHWAGHSSRTLAGLPTVPVVLGVLAAAIAVVDMDRRRSVAQEEVIGDNLEVDPAEH